MLCDHLAPTRFQLDSVSVCCEISVGTICEGGRVTVNGLTELI